MLKIYRDSFDFKLRLCLLWDCFHEKEILINAKIILPCLTKSLRSCISILLILCYSNCFDKTFFQSKLKYVIGRSQKLKKSTFSSNKFFSHSWAANEANEREVRLSAKCRTPPLSLLVRLRTRPHFSHFAFIASRLWIWTKFFAILL